jgi:multimeric flavodoxin WrbA
MKDELTHVLDKLKDADAVILGSPVYLGNSTGETAIPVLDKNTCERRLNILIFRNNFISLSTFPEYESKGMF